MPVTTRKVQYPGILRDLPGRRALQAPLDLLDWLDPLDRLDPLGPLDRLDREALKDHKALRDRKALKVPRENSPVRTMQMGNI
ncbi:MAG TPA: hypothetical protein VEH09_02285 [Thermodesulfobacteriota bacterium]|nr:hypothetical protein [Thermodesulfobacteriota bacterium]